MSTAPQVILANEDVLARDILRRAFGSRELDVVAEAYSIDQLHDAVADHPTAVVVTDAQLESVLVEETAKHLPGENFVVVLSGETSPARLSMSLVEPVRGYLLFDSAPEEVVNAVVAVARGGLALNPTAAAIVVDHYRHRADVNAASWRGRPLFTPRETDVLGALVEGMSTKSIARRLGMATKTVENHKLRIFDKLGVRTQAQAVMVAVRQGLVAPSPDGA